MNKNLAIKGHPTRGKEVIEILEILGGINARNLYGDESYAYYTIDSDKEIKGGIYVFGDEQLCHFTLEEFLEKFPYKIGDKVLARGSAGEITDMKWQGDSFFTIKEGGEVVYTVMLDTEEEITFLVEDLQPYKEETMKDYLVTEEDYRKTLKVEQIYIDAAERLMNQLADGTRWKCKDFDSKKMIALFLKKNTNIITEKEDSIIVDIPRGYEFAEVDDDKQQVVFTKMQPQYPKTYKECCEVLSLGENGKLYTKGYKAALIQDFQKLLICRNAYWKIYGEQMGLGKPWEPDWENKENTKYCITTINRQIRTITTDVFNYFLVFPTEEMRDAFLNSEEIAQLIESCKELL